MSRNPRSPYRFGLGWILGFAFEDTLTRPIRLAQEFTFVRCHGLPRASSPHGLTAPAGCRLTTSPTACSCLWLAVATNSPREGLTPPIQCPCQAHLRSHAGYGFQPLIIVHRAAFTSPLGEVKQAETRI